MQVAEIKTVKDEYETNLLSWNYTCPVCEKKIVSIEKEDDCSCFKSVFPPMTQISDKEFTDIKKDVGEKGIYLFSET